MTEPSALLQQIIDAANTISAMQYNAAHWENECRDALVNAERAGCGCLVTIDPLSVAANVFVPAGQIMIINAPGFGTIE